MEEREGRKKEGDACLPSAMRCSGTCRVILTMSGQLMWDEHTRLITQLVTLIKVRVVLFTGLLGEPTGAAEERYRAETSESQHQLLTSASLEYSPERCPTPSPSTHSHLLVNSFGCSREDPREAIFPSKTLSLYPPKTPLGSKNHN